MNNSDIMRYLDILTWEEIANKMFYSVATIKRWHNKALEIVNVNDLLKIAKSN